MTSTVFRRVASVSCLVFASVAMPAHPAWAVTEPTCQLGSSTLQITASDETTEVSVASGQIVVRRPGITPATCSGGPPTVTNVNLIEIDGGAAAETLELSLANPFEPGATAEGTGTSEIELDISLIDHVRIIGSSGDDSVVVGSGLLTNLNEDDDADIISVQGAASYRLTGGLGNDELSAAGGIGTGGPATTAVQINGGFDDDGVEGGAASDLLTGGPGDDTVSGGEGGDFLGNTSAVFPFDETGSDVLQGEGGDDFLGGGGTLSGGSGDDILLGSTGDDDLSGGENDDSVSGGSGADALFGNGGVDDLFGGAGRDRLRGGAGEDREFGEEGNDFFDQEATSNGGDLLDGGDGFDTLDYSRRTRQVRVLYVSDAQDDGQQGEGDFVVEIAMERVRGGSAGDRFFGHANEYFKDIFLGGRGGDVLVGGAGNDEFSGGPGGDDIRGGADHDTLSGDEGNDKLNGGPGADLCEGGPGRDRIRSCSNS